MAAYAALEVARPIRFILEAKAMKRLWLSAALGALAMGFAAAPASAAPTSGLRAGEAISSQSSPVEQARHRCYSRRGVLHCPRHGYRRYYQYYGSPYDDGYYGPYSGYNSYYGPGFGLYFGGGHHGGGHHGGGHHGGGHH